MASVRMSNSLRSKIRSTAQGLFANSSNTIRDSFAKDFHDRAAREFVEYQFTPHMSIMPAEYTATINRVTYYINYAVENQEAEYAWDEEILLNPIKIIKIYDYYSEGYGNGKILSIPKEFEFSQILRNELSLWRKKLRDCQTEESEFLDEITRITTRCNTVKQYLDTWPQGENLLPAEILQTFNKKPEKREKVPIITEEASVTLSATLLKRTIMS